MYKDINLEEMINEFQTYDRDYFSRDGYKALFEFFEECYSEEGAGIELDVIAICCQFSEYNLTDYIFEYLSEDELKELMADNNIQCSGDITIDILVDNNYLGYSNSYINIDDNNIITF